jgi:hypothetical protein
MFDSNAISTISRHFILRRNQKMKRTVVFLITIFMILGITSSAFAHSIFYSPSWTGYNLSWYYRTATNQAYIKVNQDYIIETDYLEQSYVDIARYRWYSTSTRVSAIHTSFSSSNVDYLTPAESYWIDHVGYSNRYCVVAYTDLVNLDGVYLNASNISYSNRSVRYAAVYVSPYDTTWDNYSSYRRKAILAHEMGHFFCLGHPDDPNYPENIYNSEDSIMEYYAEDIAYYPTPHDTVDLQFKYYE